MRIYIEKHNGDYYVCQGDDAEEIAGPFDFYEDAEAENPAKLQALLNGHTIRL